ncbi:MAG: transposase [Cyanobacteria bacterium J06638_22]
MSKKTRRKFTPELKAAIVRRHLVDKVPVSDLCDEYRIQPSMFYQWQSLVMGNLEAAFGPSKRNEPNTRAKNLEAENQSLKAKLARKDYVIAEISEEYVALKKELGDL